VVSNNEVGTSDLSAKLNRLEDQVGKLSAQIKTNKQTISELKLYISQRDTQIQELERKLGYAQQSLLEKAVNKIEQCRVQIKIGMNEKIINPAVTQIQQHIKTVQELVDESKAVLIEKKAFVDTRILFVRDQVAQCPEQAKLHVEKSIIAPAQALYHQTLESIGSQAKTTRNLVENKAIYPAKVLFDEIAATAESLPDKFMSLLQTQFLEPITQAKKKAASVANTIYPDTIDFISKKTGCVGDIFHQALSEIANQVKKSPFWDGKNRVKVGY
jgi:septal ring factor EnvC (AmiA/AmiB activator)